MSQTTYLRDRIGAVPGLVSRSIVGLTVSYPAGEAITPGRMVELQSNGTVKHPQNTTLTKPVGVACFSPTNQMNAIPSAGFTYAIGDMVPVLRQGRVYASFVGGSPAALVAAKVNHSSTIATDRGTFSASAANAGAGVEITATTKSQFVEACPGNAACWLMDVDFASGAGP